MINKEMGLQDYNGKQLDLANNMKKLGRRVFPRASGKGHSQMKP